MSSEGPPPPTPRDASAPSEQARLERLAAMGTLAAGFAHEIRNPMASLRSLAESLGEELAEAGVELPHVGRMLEVLERVEALVKTTLLFGRPAAPRAGAHDVVRVLRDAVTALGPRVRQMGAELVVRCAPGLPQVHVDDRQVVQVLVILLNNALDATGDPGRVWLEAGADAHAAAAGAPSVWFQVWDDGPGIPDYLRERIFDPFFTTKASGTGLGLSIAQQLVGDNGGRIDLVSSAGGPTSFRVWLPARAPEGPLAT